MIPISRPVFKLAVLAGVFIGLLLFVFGALTLAARRLRPRLTDPPERIYWVVMTILSLIALALVVVSEYRLNAILSGP